MPAKLCAALSPMAKVSDGGLNLYVGLIVKCNCLDIPGTAH